MNSIFKAIEGYAVGYAVGYSMGYMLWRICYVTCRLHVGFMSVTCWLHVGYMLATCWWLHVCYILARSGGDDEERQVHQTQPG